MSADASKKHIGFLVMALLVLSAGVCDLITLIPFVGLVVAPAFWILVSFYLWRKGYGLINARRGATSLISMIAEMIPAVQFLPLNTVGIIILIIFLKLEEKTGLKLPVGGKKLSGNQPLNSGGVRPPTSSRTLEQPLNVDGVRAPV